MAVGKGKKTYSRVLAQALLGEMSCWDDMPPKRSNDELEPLGAYHEGETESESTHITTGRKATTSKQTK